MLAIRTVPFDHPDAVALIARLQDVYRERYGDVDATRVDPAEFAAPRGLFLIGHLDGDAVACGGWRARDSGEDPALDDGDAEIKRMFVDGAHRGRGFARTVLSELERTAAAIGRRRVVLETGTGQPEAVALYLSCGYAPIPRFGAYRDDPRSLCYAKPLRVAV